MADKYSTIQQHQPLRVPSGWDKQEKMLIVQLDEIFDDIYRRFGRLRIEDMGEKFRKRIEDDEGNISELVIDVGQITIDVGNKYDKVSGITIDANGIDITGSKYVKIRSGGTFDVDSTNFKISTTGKYLITGDWTIDDYGLYRKGKTNNTDTLFAVGDYTASGLSNVVKATITNLNTYSVVYGKVYPEIYFSLSSTDNVSYRMKITPRLEDSSAAVKIANPSSSPSYNVIGSGSSYDSWFVYGGIVTDYTGDANFNNYVLPGVYSLPSNMTNKPSDSIQGAILVVLTPNTTPTSGSTVYQMIINYNAIYIRSGSSASWSGWYKFSGTSN